MADERRSNPLIDLLIVLTGVGVVAWLGWMQLDKAEHDRRIDQTAAAVRSFEQMIRLRSAAKDAELNARGWPITIEPGWFEDRPPRNYLVSADRPWVDVAPPEHAAFTHPEIRLAITREQASFWYNPYQGIVRARVPVAINDEQTLELYNRVNHTELKELYRRAELRNADAAEPDPTDAPIDAPADSPAGDPAHTDPVASAAIGRMHVAGERGLPGLMRWMWSSCRSFAQAE